MKEKKFVRMTNQFCNFKFQDYKTTKFLLVGMIKMYSARRNMFIIF